MAGLTFQLTQGEASGEITLTDGEIGRLMRYSQYGQGGFQGRFKAAFSRSFRDVMA
jgi:hypothetical protein